MASQCADCISVQQLCYLVCSSTKNGVHLWGASPPPLKQIPAPPSLLVFLTTGGNYNRSRCDPPPSYLSKLGGGGSFGGGRVLTVRVGGVPKGGGAARNPLQPHAYVEGGRMSGGMGAWSYVCDNSAFLSWPERKGCGVASPPPLSPPCPWISL